MFPIIPVLCSHTTEHKTDELLSMQKYYKTNNYYIDTQKTT